MSHYRRRYRGGMFFFTVLTYQRRKILTSDAGRKCLKEAIEKTKESYPFVMKCMCLLPEHFHCIMELPGEDKNYSLRISLIKQHFTRGYLADRGREACTSQSMKMHRNRGIWQRRFWEQKKRSLP